VNATFERANASSGAFGYDGVLGLGYTVGTIQFVLPPGNYIQSRINTSYAYTCNFTSNLVSPTPNFNRTSFMIGSASNSTIPTFLESLGAQGKVTNRTIAWTNSSILLGEHPKGNATLITTPVVPIMSDVGYSWGINATAINGVDVSTQRFMLSNTDGGIAVPEPILLQIIKTLPGAFLRSGQIAVPCFLIQLASIYIQIGESIVTIPLADLESPSCNLVCSLRIRRSAGYSILGLPFIKATNTILNEDSNTVSLSTT